MKFTNPNLYPESRATQNKTRARLCSYLLYGRRRVQHKARKYRRFVLSICPQSRHFRDRKFTLSPRRKCDIKEAGLQPCFFYVLLWSEWEMLPFPASGTPSARFATELQTWTKFFRSSIILLFFVILFNQFMVFIEKFGSHQPNSDHAKRATNTRCPFCVVWVRRFELPASWTPFKRATKLRYTQISRICLKII